MRKDLSVTRLCWQRKRTASRDPLRWPSSCDAYAKQLVSQHQVVLRSRTFRMHHWSSLLRAARPCAIGVAPLSPWWRTAPWNRWWRPTWTSSTCLARLSGRAPATACARTSHRLRSGLSGSIGPTPSPSRATSLASFRAPWFWATRGTPTCVTTFHFLPQVFVRSWSLTGGSKL